MMSLWNFSSSAFGGLLSRTSPVTQTTTVHLSLNQSELCNNTRLYLAFLQKIHKTGVTVSNGSSSIISLDRYLNYWLPLVADADEIQQWIPPPDVAWLRHCHRLSPFHYQSYCRKRFGKVAETLEPFSFQVADAEDGTKENHTQKTWYSPFPNEPFFLGKADVTMEYKSGLSRTNTEMDGFDLLSSARRHSTFLWRTSQPRFKDPVFLEQGVEQYYQFLTLKNESNNLFPLIPTTQIELIWRTHNASSVAKYCEDCMVIRGEPFSPDDSFNDVSSVESAFQETCRLWRDTYGEDLIVDERMHRGDPPPEFYDPLWDSEALTITATTKGSTKLAGSTSNGKQNVGLDDKGTNSREDILWKRAHPVNDTFIPYFPKRNGLFVNSNPQKEGYVFGTGIIWGVGYYSFGTKDAYVILHRRLVKVEEKLQKEYEPNCCSCFVRPKTEIEHDIVRTIAMIAYFEARLLTKGPQVPLADDDMKKRCFGALERYNLEHDTPYVNGYWMITGNHRGSEENQDPIVQQAYQVAACTAETLDFEETGYIGCVGGGWRMLGCVLYELMSLH